MRWMVKEKNSWIEDVEVERGDLEKKGKEGMSGYMGVVFG